MISLSLSLSLSLSFSLSLSSWCIYIYVVHHKKNSQYRVGFGLLLPIIYALSVPIIHSSSVDDINLSNLEHLSVFSACANPLSSESNLITDLILSRFHTNLIVTATSKIDVQPTLYLRMVGASIKIQLELLITLDGEMACIFFQSSPFVSQQLVVSVTFSNAMYMHGTIYLGYLGRFIRTLCMVPATQRSVPNYP